MTETSAGVLAIAFLIAALLFIWLWFGFWAVLWIVGIGFMSLLAGGALLSRNASKDNHNDSA